MAGYETIISGTSPSITAVTQLDGTPIFSATTSGITFGVPVSGAGGYATGVRQIVYATSSTYASTSVVIPVDNTIPQITEGAEFLTATITPQSATSRLIVMLSTQAAPVNIATVTLAIFRDATANAIGSTCESANTANTAISLSCMASVISGSTSATTFRMRLGANSGQVFVNGSSGGAYFGGVSATSMSVIEVGA